jgi:rubrerythrin
MDNDTLFDIFKVAIMNEHEAYEFYRKAAAGTANMEAKKLFEDFATTELGHRAQLEELYKTLKK